MAETGVPKASLKQRISHELKEFAIIAAYLCVCFTAITYFKFAVLQANEIPFAPFGFAATKALICAKFICLGHMIHLGESHKPQALIWPVLRKSSFYLLLLFVLDAVEEVIIGLMHGRPLIASLAEVSGGTRDQLIARSFLGLLMLLPFFALRELGNVVGGRTLARLFFEQRQGIDHAASDTPR